jgi:hypothetical protein
LPVPFIDGGVPDPLEGVESVGHDRIFLVPVSRFFRGYPIWIHEGLATGFCGNLSFCFDFSDIREFDCSISHIPRRPDPL